VHRSKHVQSSCYHCDAMQNVCNEVCPLSYNEKAQLWCFKSVMVLQNCVGLVKDEPDSCSEACITNADEGSDEYGIKFEEAIHIKEENTEATFPPISREPEVRFWCVCVCVYVYRLAWLQVCECPPPPRFHASQIIYCLKKKFLNYAHLLPSFCYIVVSIYRFKFAF
jgi:hypothetical protein